MKTFKDYTCKELVGQLVLFHTSFRNGKPSTQQVATIIKANKHHFSISKSALLQFDYSGRQLLHIDAVEQSQISTCLLITLEQADQLKTKWANVKRLKLETEMRQLKAKQEEIQAKLNLQEL